MSVMRLQMLGLMVLAACSTQFFAPGEVLDESGSDDASETATAVQGNCLESVEAMTGCIDRDNYVTDLKFIAAPRPPGDAHWQAVQDLCFERFTAYGYEVELHQYGTGVNVIGTKLGAVSPSEVIVVAAHYDHIPSCAGADDNATGVAGVLEVARVLAQASLERTVVVACWDQEELGLIGSRSWVLRANTKSDTILANFNFEMIGYTDDAANTQSVPAGFDVVFPEAIAELASNNYAANFIAIVADDLALAPAQAIERHADRLGLPLLHLGLPDELKNSPLLNDLRRSDHATFWEFDHPAMMITDTSNFRYDAYHCGDGQDTVDNLDHEFTTKVLRASTGAIVELAGLMPAPAQ